MVPWGIPTIFLINIGWRWIGCVRAGERKCEVWDVDEWYRWDWSTKNKVIKIWMSFNMKQFSFLIGLEKSHHMLL